MKFELTQPFSLEIPQDGKEDEIIIGTLSQITKKQQKEFEKDFKKNKDGAIKLQLKTRQLKRLSEKLERGDSTDHEAKYTLEDEIEAELEKLKILDTEETTSKKRFEISVTSESLERLKELAEIVGYSHLMSVIVKDVTEKQGNDTPAS